MLRFSRSVQFYLYLDIFKYDFSNCLDNFALRKSIIVVVEVDEDVEMLLEVLVEELELEVEDVDELVDEVLVELVEEEVDEVEVLEVEDDVELVEVLEVDDDVLLVEVEVGQPELNTKLSTVQAFITVETVLP